MHFIRNDDDDVDSHQIHPQSYLLKIEENIVIIFILKIRNHNMKKINST